MPQPPKRLTKKNAQKSEPKTATKVGKSRRGKSSQGFTGKPKGKSNGARRPYSPQQQQRPQAVELELDITGLTEDGEPFAVPTNRQLASEYPRIIVDPTGRALKVGDTVWAEVFPDPTKKLKKGKPVTQFIATVLDKASPERADTHGRDSFLGVVRHEGANIMIRALHRELAASDFIVRNLPDATMEDIPNGAVVRVVAGKRPNKGATPVELREVLGQTLKGMESRIAIDNHRIPHEFSKEVLAAAKKLKAFAWDAKEGREDLRQVPIVTIDGADSRDFDDAVWAEPTKSGGHHIIVAIADVAHYIHPGSALDLEGYQRGNSTYFPDAVVPMLPERISNDLCSLVPQQDRPVLAVHLYIDAKGKLTKFKFVRAVIYSHARLTYTQVQDALDGKPDSTTKPLLSKTIQPLYAAFQTLLEARKTRGAFDLDIPEPYIVADDDGTIHGVETRSRLDSHRLIEEIMILANVAAARALAEQGRGTLYRIHPEPDDTKMQTLGGVLKSHGLKFVQKSPTGKDYQKLVAQLKQHKCAPILLKSVLQSQMQAKYSPDNIGHFGLNLSHYSHFTSPIRRYSDLIVHRALIQYLALAGEGGVPSPDGKLEGQADHLNITERLSQLAEWEARDRMMARYMSDKTGEIYDATVISVQSFGIFVVLPDGVTEGLLPMRKLEGDYYRYDEANKKLIGRRTRRVFQVGTKLKVKLIEADPVAARLTFGLG